MGINEENVKLEKVTKSCKAALICSRIIFMFLAVATVLTLITSIVLVANADKYNTKINEALKKGDIKTSISIGSINFATIEDGAIKMSNDAKLESSIPALNDYFKTRNDSPAFVLGFYILLVSVLCAILAFAVWMISTVFDIIVKEGNPFADSVPKRLLVAMITLTVLVGMMVGIGFAVLLALVTWAVYSIVDYGRYLRIQSDETL